MDEIFVAQHVFSKIKNTATLPAFTLNTRMVTLPPSRDITEARMRSLDLYRQICRMVLVSAGAIIHN
jgi:hypothetical protein